MYLEFQERNDVVNNSKKVILYIIILHVVDLIPFFLLQVEFKFPAEIIKQNPHKTSVCRVSHLTDGSMVSCSLVCMYTYKHYTHYVHMYVGTMFKGAELAIVTVVTSTFLHNFLP